MNISDQLGQLAGKEDSGVQFISCHTEVVQPMGTELNFDHDLFLNECHIGESHHSMKTSALSTCRLIRGCPPDLLLLNSEFNIEKNEEIFSKDEGIESFFDQPIEEMPNRKKEIYAFLGKVEEMSTDKRLFARNSLLQRCKHKMKSFETWHCIICNEPFSSILGYLNHMDLHHPGQIWTCSECGSQFSQKKMLLDHEISMHKEARHFSCAFCVLSFSRKNNLEEHIKNIHHKKPVYKCSLCDKSFVRSYDLKMHLNVHFRIKLHICDLCGKQFTHPSNLFRHQRTHYGIKPYLCQVCNQRFTQIQALKAHESSHSNVSCPYCGSDFRSIPSFIRHAKLTHSKLLTFKEASTILNKVDVGSFTRNFYCSLCGDKSQFKAELALHQKEAHGSESHSCCLRLKSSDNADSLKEHSCLVDKRGDAKVPKESIECFGVSSLSTFENGDADDLTLICSIEEGSHGGPFKSTQAEVIDHPKYVGKKNKEDIGFSKQFSQQKSIVYNKESLSASNLLNVNHKLSPSKQVEDNLDHFVGINENTQNLEKVSNKKKRSTMKFPLICQDCGKKFNRSWNYQQHLATHDSSLRRYICKFCGLSFSYSSSLSKHLLKHSPNQNFSCTECLKHYKSKGALLQHQKKIHYKKMNFACKSCDKTFFNKPEHEYHMRIHAKERPYLCSTCGKKFSHVSHLHRHEKLHSGEKPHTCPHCPKAFIQKTSLQAHLKKHKIQTFESSTQSEDMEEMIEDASSLALGGFSLDNLACLEGKGYLKSTAISKERMSFSMNDSVTSDASHSDNCKETTRQEVIVSLEEEESNSSQELPDFVEEDGCIIFLEID